MAREIRVKVATDKLLEAVKVRREQMVKDHERAAKGYDAKAAAYRERVAKALRKAADDVENGRQFDTNYRGITIPVRGGHHAPEKATFNTAGIDRLIKTLEMASEPTMTITSDDAARYLG